jgi:hypothetical protein
MTSKHPEDSLSGIAPDFQTYTVLISTGLHAVLCEDFPVFLSVSAVEIWDRFLNQATGFEGLSRRSDTLLYRLYVFMRYFHKVISHELDSSGSG